jgi:hypothetical protein
VEALDRSRCLSLLWSRKVLRLQPRGSGFHVRPHGGNLHFRHCLQGLSNLGHRGRYGGSPTWTGKGTKRGQTNQTKTVIGGYDLLPVTYSQRRRRIHLYRFGERDLPCGGYLPYRSRLRLLVSLNPSLDGEGQRPTYRRFLPTSSRMRRYRYRYRSSATGATSNPSPPSLALTLPVSSTDLTPVPSVDPQVDKIDWFREDAGLLEFTYVGTSPNASTPFTDSLLDTDVAGNPLLEFDNYEPFPSIDLPKAGVVNIAAGAVSGTLDVTWVSGNQFNVRWLPGTVIVLGTVAYTLYNRPSLATALTVVLIGDAPTALLNQPYEIAQPILAAQPMPSMWGPTDNAAFMFACGDSLRPGTLYWTKGNNPDSAPQTNTSEVTSPSEPLMNGVIVNGIGMVFSTERAWLIYPNFFNALATVTGTIGSTWTLQESITDRGLYIRNCVCTDGGKTVYFRGKDGIYVSPGGVGAVSITDADIWNIFPHEGFTPVSITRAGYTIYPPDDTQPELQSLRVANGYVYYDYVSTDNVRRTILFDIVAKGWVVDVYGVPVTTHVLEEGPDINGTLVGCTDGTVRPLVSGAEASSTTHVTHPPFGPAGNPTLYFGTFYDEAARTLYWVEGHGTFGFVNVMTPTTLTQHLITDPVPNNEGIPWTVAPNKAFAVVDGIAYWCSENQYGLGTIVGFDLATDSMIVREGGGILGGDFGPCSAGATVNISGTNYVTMVHSTNVYLVRASDGFKIYYNLGPFGTLGSAVQNPFSGVVLSITDDDNNSWLIGSGMVSKVVWNITIPPVPTAYAIADLDPKFGCAYDSTDRTLVYGTAAGAIVKWSIDSHTEVSRNAAAGIGSLYQVTSTGLIVSSSLDTGGGAPDRWDKVRLFNQALVLQSEYSLSSLGLTAPINGPIAFNPNTIWFGRYFDPVGPGFFVEDNNQAVSYVPIAVAPFNEGADCVLLTQAVNAGDTRADKRIGDIFLRANIVPTNPVAIYPYSSIYATALTGYAPTALSSGTERYQPFIVDFVDGLSQTVDDIEAAFVWAVGQTTYLSLWQPNFILLPEGVQDRPTDFDDAGTPGAKFVQGFILECDTFGLPKAFAVENCDDGSLHIPNESPVTSTGQKIIPFTFTPPFVAHSMRLISTDGVPWRRWGLNWVVSPFPESVVEWQSEFTSHGLLGWQHVRELNIAHISTEDLQLTIVPDVGDPIIVEVPNSNGLQVKTKVTVFANKAKLFSYRLSSSVPFRVFEPDIEVKVKQWGSEGQYEIVKPFGGPSAAKALV